MEKGLARFRVSLLCFCCGCFVAAGLERLVCCSWFVATGLLQLVCGSCFVALFCCTEVADSSRRSFPLRGPLPFSGANAACNCQPPQRRRYSNRVLVPFPFREPMPPAAVCHLSAAGTPTASWHGDHAHKYSRGIPAWRRGHLSTLWHGDPQQNHFWGRVTWQDCLEPVSNRSLADASAGLRHGIPGERPLGGIPAWRGSHLSALRP